MSSHVFLWNLQINTLRFGFEVLKKLGKCVLGKEVHRAQRVGICGIEMLARTIEQRRRLKHTRWRWNNPHAGNALDLAVFNEKRQGIENLQSLAEMARCL